MGSPLKKTLKGFDNVIKLETKNLSFEDYEILRLAGFEFDSVLSFENEDDVFEMSDVVGYFEAMHIVNHYGWFDAQELANEHNINEPLANIEEVASVIVAEIILKYGKEA